ncbi:unnamed protein product [Brassica rapa]|uniref:Uncharacterized protein n=2 Tax=Brassica TaxID=3705 RepID=A0A8D9MC96_BRACM|nr:unnamed protein product [Brassica napus]CAG7906548.1 unnamed protein product [Brassica rapa]
MTRGKTLTVQLKMYSLQYFVKAYISEGSTVLHFLEGFLLKIFLSNFLEIHTFPEIFKTQSSHDLGKRLNPFGIIIENVDVENPSLTD